MDFVCFEVYFDQFHDRGYWLLKANLYVSLSCTERNWTRVYSTPPVLWSQVWDKFNLMIWCSDLMIWCSNLMLWLDNLMLWLDDLMLWLDDLMLWLDDLMLWLDDLMLWIDDTLTRQPLRGVSGFRSHTELRFIAQIKFSCVRFVC